MPLPLRVSFIAGQAGSWRIDSVTVVKGEPLERAQRLTVCEESGSDVARGADWILTGVTSNARYTHRPEADDLTSRQQGLSRGDATCAALIPIRKTESWWSLTQDERRAIFEEQSHHIAIGMDYLPQIARRLHHSRELGEPFDFLTWFEYAPQHSGAFDDMLCRLRTTAEWSYVDREVDIRLSRSARDHGCHRTT